MNPNIYECDTAAQIRNNDSGTFSFIELFVIQEHYKYRLLLSSDIAISLWVPQEVFYDLRSLNLIYSIFEKIRNVQLLQILLF